MEGKRLSDSDRREGARAAETRYCFVLSFPCFLNCPPRENIDAFYFPNIKLGCDSELAPALGSSRLGVRREKIGSAAATPDLRRHLLGTVVWREACWGRLLGRRRTRRRKGRRWTLSAS